MSKIYVFLSSLFVLMLGSNVLTAQTFGNFVLKATSATAAPQSNVCIDIKAHSNNPILAMQYSMTYDPTVLAFESVQNFNLPGLSASSFGLPNDSGTISEGTITVSWLDNNNEWQDIEDGESIYQVCFTVVGAVGSYSEINFSDSPTPFEVIGLSDASLAVSHVGGQVYVGGEAAALAIIDCSMTIADCQNASLGDINITVAGGTAPYTYNWLSWSGETYVSEDISDLSAGAYYLVVTDANNTSVSAFFQLNPIEHAVFVNAEVFTGTCQDDDGSIILTPVGNDNVSAEWSNGFSGLHPTGLAAGNYSVTITNTETGCQQVENYTVNASSDMQVGLAYECQIPFNATLTVIVWNNNNPPYTFSLAGGTTVTDDQLAEFTVPLNSNQTVTVTDASGCSITSTHVIDCEDDLSDELVLSANNRSVAIGETFCVPVQVEGFASLYSLQFAMQWNPTVIQFENVEGFNLPNLSSNANFGLTDEPLEDGILRFSWLDDEQQVGTTLADGSTIFEVCFTAIGDTGVSSLFTFQEEHPIPWEAINTSIHPISVSSDNATITIEGENNNSDEVTFIASDEMIFVGEEVCVDISVRDFSPVLSMQYSLHWDASVIEFIAVHPTEELDDFNESSFGLHSTDEGFLTLAWHDSQAMNGSFLMDDAVLFQVCFDGIGEDGTSSAIQFTGAPTPVEIYGSNDQELNMIAVEGSVTIDGEGFVLPGDTDRDLAVSHFDLLNIGLGFGQTGTARANASMAFEPQLSGDWNIQTPISGIDFKHADTDGNGIVNADDILALIQNIGENFNFLGEDTNQFNDEQENRDDMSPFFVETTAVQTGETVSFPIVLGTNDQSITDLYGIAFSIVYDKEIIEVESLLAQFENSWLGTTEDLMMIQKDNYETGRIDIALTRKDAHGISGAGVLGAIEMTIKDIILNEEEYPLHFKIENVKAISPAEMPIETATQETTAVVTGATVNGTTHLDLAANISIQPNPVQDFFLIKTTDVELQQVEIYNIAGQLIATYNAVNEVNTKALTNGTYLVKMLTTEGVITKRIMVQK